MSKKYLLILFYGIFVLLGSLSLVFIPQALDYSTGSIVALLILSVPSFYFLYSKFGWGIFLKVVLSLSMFALFVEYIGLVTGWPDGSFVYMGHLGYKILGVLPWTVGLSWTPLVIGSVALVYTNTNRKILRIVLPVVLLVAFDLLLDPIAVHLGMWSYVHGGAYYNVPLQNFVGWIFSGLIGSLICFMYLDKRSVKKIYQLSYSFFMSIIFWTIVSVGLGLVVPAIFGLCLVVCCVMIYCKNNEKASQY